MSAFFENDGSVQHGAAGPEAVKLIEQEEFLSRTTHTENLPSSKLC